MGFMMQMLQFQEERMYGAASACGLDNLIDQTIDYTRQRHTFGAARSWTTRWCISAWPSCAPRSRRCAP
jgi:alkylation response protein AidB-like acyl-CoA dehydrogenase